MCMYVYAIQNTTIHVDVSGGDACFLHVYDVRFALIHSPAMVLLKLLYATLH